MKLQDYLDKNNISYEGNADNLTVGGNLDLENCTGITSLPDNLTVGGNLYLRGTGITALPDNLTVGGTAYYNNTEKHIGAKVDRPTIQLPEIYTWQNGQYIKADGIFMEVVSKRGNIYRARKINKQDVTYLITDGNGKWSHGSTLAEAKADLVYKIGNRDKSKFQHLTKDSILTFGECIEAYRVITGACAFGARNFVESRLVEKKDEYMISEVIALTKGMYGNETFERFFNK